MMTLKTPIWKDLDYNLWCDLSDKNLVNRGVMADCAIGLNTFGISDSKTIINLILSVIIDE